MFCVLCFVLCLSVWNVAGAARGGVEQSIMSSAARDAVARSLRPIPHEILGVPRDADEPTLRRAYRMTVKLLHPDKCVLPEADAAFKRVTEAFNGLLAMPRVVARPPPAAAPVAVPPPPAPDMPWLGRSNKPDGKFTVRVAKGPRRPAARQAAQPQQVNAGDGEDEDDDVVDDDGGDSDFDSDDDDDEGISFAEEGATRPPTVRSLGGDESSSAGRGEAKAPRARKEKKVRKRKKKRRHDDFIADSDEDFGEEEESRGHRRRRGEEHEWRPAADPSLGADRGQGRRSRRNSGRRRVNYARLGEGGEEDDEDGEAGASGGGAAESTAWKPPLWFEYQTDSDDDEEQAQRKKSLKQRVLSAKRAADEGRSAEAAFGEGEPVAATLEPTAEAEAVAAAEPFAEEDLGEADDVGDEEEEDDLDALLGD